MQRIVIAIALAASAAIFAAGLWMNPTEPQEPMTAEADTPVATRDEPRSLAPPEPRAKAPADAPATTAAAEPVEEAPPPGLTEEEARRRRQLALERAAEARFKEAVELDRLDARKVNPAVRDLFRTVKLEPVVDPDRTQEGYISGMRIAQLLGDSPLASAGFRVGDRLTRIGGEPLVDPAQIAHLFARLGQRFEICAARSGGEHCRMVVLDEG